MNYSFNLFSLSLIFSFFFFLAAPAPRAFSQTALVSSSSVTALTTPPAASIGCATVIPSGKMVLVEHFFTTYEYAFRRVAKFRAYGFTNARLLHTDCQSVDVDGDFYMVALSDYGTTDQEMLDKMHAIFGKGAQVGIEVENLRIVRSK